MAMGLDRNVARLALAVGVVGLASVVSLALFFAIQGPFGTINDWSIGVFGALTAVLAIVLHRLGLIAPPSRAMLASGAAVVGGAIVVVGSALVISDTTGFLLAGLVESLGFALIGIWLIALNRSGASTLHRPQRLRDLGTVAGIVMAIGFVVVPGIAMGLDDMDTAPVWVWVGFVGWLGIFFLYPIWSLWFGTILQRGD
jgi:hypothetical protein